MFFLMPRVRCWSFQKWFFPVLQTFVRFSHKYAYFFTNLWKMNPTKLNVYLHNLPVFYKKMAQNYSQKRVLPENIVWSSQKCKRNKSQIFVNNCIETFGGLGHLVLFGGSGIFYDYLALLWQFRFNFFPFLYKEKSGNPASSLACWQSTDKLKLGRSIKTGHKILWSLFPLF
jgi:hypothetical protein